MGFVRRTAFGVGALQGLVLPVAAFAGVPPCCRVKIFLAPTGA